MLTVVAAVVIAVAFLACDKDNGNGNGNGNGKNPSGSQITMRGNYIGGFEMKGTGTVTIDWGNTKTETHTLSSTGMVYSHSYLNYEMTYNVKITGNITYLVCDAYLINIDVSNNTALTHLEVGGNLTSLDVSKNIALTYLDCSHNRLTNLDVSKNTKLKELYCEWNRLTTLDVSKNTALTHLDCNNNNLALNSLFGTLHSNNISGGKVIGIEGNLDYWDCDRSIAENKGWTVYDVLRK